MNIRTFNEAHELDKKIKACQAHINRLQNGKYWGLEKRCSDCYIQICYGNGSTNMTLTNDINRVAHIRDLTIAATKERLKELLNKFEAL